MNRKTVFSPAVLALAVIMAWGTACPAFAQKDDMPYETDKPDRTIIKEIRVKQDQILNALNDIKNELNKLQSSVKQCTNK